MPATLLDAAEEYVVLRPFPALGRMMERGEVIDCSDWRNVQPLVNTRRLAPIWSPEARQTLAALEDEGDEVDDDPMEVGLSDKAPRRRGRPHKTAEVN